MTTQTTQVLQLLRLRGEQGLTPGEALALIGTMRLASRISEAKELIGADEIIVTERVKTTGGATVAKYVLRRRPVDETRPTLWPAL